MGNDNKKIKIRGRLKGYFRWPLYMSILIVVFNVVMYSYDVHAGLISTALFFVYLGIVLLVVFLSSKEINDGLIDFATHYGQVQHQLLKQFSLPYLLLDDGGKIIWCNEAFEKTFGHEEYFRKPINSVLPALTKEKLPKDYVPVEISCTHNDKEIRAELQRIDLSEIAEQNNMPGFESTLTAVFLYDETELVTYRKKVDEEAMVAGLVYVDNYEEVLESTEDSRKTILSGYLERHINGYFSNYDAIVRKTDTDRYFVAMKRKCFDEMMDAKMDLLDTTKALRIGNEMDFTLSMGFGAEESTLSKCATLSKNAMELALGRGGDQAVVKLKDKVFYFGGKSEQMEKNTRVRARVKAQALKEIILGSENVLIMGHRNPDIDSFGSGVGIFKVCTYLNKKSHIVVDRITEAIQPLAEEFIANPDHPENTIVDSDMALSLVGNNTTLVIVDTNSPTITECPQLLKMCKKIVILDHHRQGTEAIENATLSYVEPYASSACELVAEILQYTGDNIKFKAGEADCLYAGIMIDTNNFLSKTGVRTFEAAAYLRRNGADVTRVRKLFRSDLESCKSRASAISNVELFREYYAISICQQDENAVTNVIAAQAANELLNIRGVKASFVFTQSLGKVFISARSIDEVNVQLIMEKIGGGGHLNMAGAQFEEKTIQDCVVLLKETIVNMIEQEEI